MNPILESLNWRYATKQHDPAKKLTDEQVHTLLESLRLAPSSFGLQPWKFIVVSNPEVRAKLREAAWNQPQVTDASHLVVLAVPKVVDAALADAFIEFVAKTKGAPVEALKGYADMIKGAIAGRGPDGAREWATRQAYLALGMVLTVAAMERIDASPMEGFDPKKFDEILGLEAMGLESRVMVAFGFRSPEDTASQAGRVRFPLEQVVIEVK